MYQADSAISTLTQQFVNIDGFNCGEKAELFWGIRAYEIAVTMGLKFYVWGNLDYGLRKGDWNPKFRCGHYDGKGRVGGTLPVYCVLRFLNLPRVDFAICNPSDGGGPLHYWVSNEIPLGS
jgi:hypothetical protein